MESIVIFALIAIASSVFQAMAQNNKKQKQSVKGPQPGKPKLQPQMTVRPVYKTQPTPVVREPLEVVGLELDEGVGEAVSFRGSMLETSLEGIQTEAMEERLRTEPQKTAVSNEMQQSISFDDLQKSVIMAEILGKPRALKRSIR